MNTLAAGSTFHNSNGKDYFIILALSGLVSTLILAYDPVGKKYVVATVYAAQRSLNEWTSGHYFSAEDREAAYRRFAEQAAARVEAFITFSDLEGIPA